MAAKKKAAKKTAARRSRLLRRRSSNNFFILFSLVSVSRVLWSPGSPSFKVEPVEARDPLATLRINRRRRKKCC